MKNSSYFFFIEGLFLPIFTFFPADIDLLYDGELLMINFRDFNICRQNMILHTNNPFIS